MNTPLDELRKADQPLIAETIGKALGCSPATVRRVVKELTLPAAFFVPAYSLPQVRAIALKLQAEQLESLENLQSKGPNHETPRSIVSPKQNRQQPRIGCPTDDYRDALDARRQARVRR